MAQAQEFSMDSRLSQFNLRCNLHRDELYQRYCTDCSVPVCIDCIANDHGGHNVRKFGDIINKKKAELSTVLGKAKAETLVDISRKIEKSRTLRQEFICETEKIIEAVQDRAEQMKKDVDQASKDIQEKLEGILEDYKNDFDLAETEMMRTFNKIKLVVEEYEVGLSSCDCSKIIEGCQSFSDEVEQLLPNVSIPSEGPPFFRTDCSNIDIKTLFGALEEESENSSDVVEDSFTLNKHKFTRLRNSPIRVRRHPSRGINRKKLNLNADIRTPSRIKVANDKTDICAVATFDTNAAAIITNEPANDRQVCIVRRNTYTTDKITIKDEVHRIAIRDPDHIYYTTRDGSQLQFYDLSKNTVDQVKDFSPLIVGGLCALDSGGMACGVLDRIDYVPAQNATRAVCVLNDKYVTDLELEFDGNKSERLFTFPTRIAELKRSELCVIDRLSETKGRLIVVRKSSKVKFVYEGLQRGNNFDPTDVAAHGCSIFVVDRHFGIHEVTECGIFARYVLNQTAVLYPISISIDTEAKAWIGCENGYILRMRIVQPQNAFSLISVNDSQC